MKSIDEIKSVIETLMKENTGNLADSTDVYAQGYHDALLDVMDSFDIPHTEKHFD